ncbi:MAG: HAD-IIB family hydrolase [Bacteroidetes bacterium]|nr:HAD-IIB family hydrolase [Bacteroidota bacterium]
MKILFTDLDGTLLRNDKTTSLESLRCLEDLGSQNVVRVIATGRSWFSYKKVIPNDFPADFLLFSTGAGVIDLNNNKILFSSDHQKKDIEIISESLITQNVDFMVHCKVPENHRFVYFRCTKNNEDFERRIKLYKNYAVQYGYDGNGFPGESAQIIAIFSENQAKFSTVMNSFNGFQTTRTTSPLDGKSMWLEINPSNISKGKGAQWLCEYLHVHKKDSVGIGNDYNDISLLEFTEKSYVVANAPEELLAKYIPTKSNDQDGFSLAVHKCLGKNL